MKQKKCTKEVKSLTSSACRRPREHVTISALLCSDGLPSSGSRKLFTLFFYIIVQPSEGTSRRRHRHEISRWHCLRLEMGFHSTGGEIFNGCCNDGKDSVEVDPKMTARLNLGNDVRL